MKNGTLYNVNTGKVEEVLPIGIKPEVAEWYAECEAKGQCVVCLEEGDVICELCKGEGYSWRSAWSVGLKHDLLIGTYLTATDEQARNCALDQIKRDGIRYVAVLEVRSS